MEYVNELPIIQIVIDFVEADDVIAYAARHLIYGFWNKIIVSSDKDFFQLCDDYTSIYRPIQDKLLQSKLFLRSLKYIPIILPLLVQLLETQAITYRVLLALGLKQLQNAFLSWLTNKNQIIKRLLKIVQCKEKGLNYMKTLSNLLIC